MKDQAVKYKAKIGQKELNLYYYEDNLWLTLNNISELFNCSIQKIYTLLHQVVKKSKTPINRYNRYIEITLDNGVRSRGNFYNLDIVMAIGYMINPKVAMEFYQRTQTLYKTTLLQSSKNRRFFSRIF